MAIAVLLLLLLLPYREWMIGSFSQYCELRTFI